MTLYFDAECFQATEAGMTANSARYARIAYGMALLSGITALGVGALKQAGLVPAPLALVAAVAPLVPLIAFIVYVIRLIRALDELQRLIHLEALMLQFGATAIAVMGYGMLARAGFLPNVTLVQAYPFLWIALFLFWAGGLFLVRRRYQ
jgi:hypothetical protein